MEQGEILLPFLFLSIVKLSRTLSVGPSWIQKPLQTPLPPCFLVCRKKLQAPRPFLSTKGQIQTVIREGRECRNKGGAVKKQQCRVLVPPQGIYITHLLSSSAGTKAPTQVEDGNFRLSTRFLDTTLLPHYQPIRRKPHTLQPSPQILPIKNFFPKTIREFGFF